MAIEKHIYNNFDELAADFEKLLDDKKSFLSSSQSYHVSEPDIHRLASDGITSRAMPEK